MQLDNTNNHLEADENKPWGAYYVLQDRDNHKVKRIVVSPGKRLSLQSHTKRSEYWICVEGEMTVEVENMDTNIIEKMVVSEGEMERIPLGAKHRMSNETEVDAAIIEVQVGTYFGEEDIVRYEDDFGRS